jgi:thiol-disulfide isomerase/thioredoxin
MNINACWVFLLALLLTGSLSACKKKETIPEVAAPLKMALDFHLPTYTGDSLRLSDQRDKVVVLWFFGYGCCYCRASAPEIRNGIVVPYLDRTDYMVIGLDI